MDTFITFLFVITIGAIIISITYLVIKLPLSLYSTISYTTVPLDPIYIKILERDFQYYKNLSPPNKKRFLRKVKYFMFNKTFETKEDLVLTPEMKVLVSACAAQITFGYPLMKFPHFKKIILFPNKYKGETTGKYHLGEVNSKGFIIYSWKHFMKGYQTIDRYNVGLHEMAHALRLEDFIVNEEYHFLKIQLINKLEQWRLNNSEEIKKNQLPLIRKYASIDHQEFFAVCTEVFFEQPQEFSAQLPGLYRLLTHLFNQDPRRKSDPIIHH